MTVLVLALVSGALVGLALGGLGGGGSMLAVPALIYLIGLSPAQATTASLLIVGATSLVGLAVHARAGRVRWRSGALFAVAGLPTAAAAGALSSALPGALLSAAFAVLAAVAAWRMLAPRRAEAPPEAAGPTRSAAAGAGLGTVTGFLGAGGGFLAVPALVSVLAFPMPEAVGTSLLAISTNSSAALATRLSSAASVNWSVVAPFTAAAILGAWDGKRLSEKLSGSTLQKIFAVVLLVVAAVMLVGSLV